MFLWKTTWIIWDFVLMTAVIYDTIGRCKYLTHTTLFTF